MHLLDSSVKQTIALAYLQAPAKSHKKVDFYFEEEETTRLSSKDDSKNNFHSIAVCACLSSYFFQRLKSYAAFSQYLSHFSYFGLHSSELRVLRL